jgi:hypothetical protein
LNAVSSAKKPPLDLPLMVMVTASLPSMTVADLWRAITLLLS